MNKGLLCIFLFFLTTIVASAFRPVAASAYEGVADVAIGGYDTVAYFTENAAVYGGHCSFCVSASGKVETAGDPTVFFLHQNRLYLLQSRDMLDDWHANPAEHIAKANATYARLMAEFEANQG